MKKLLVLLLILFVTPFVQRVNAQETVMSGTAAEGPYLGLDVGLAIAPSTEFNTHNRGIPSRCDLHYAGQDGFVTSVASFSGDSDCTASAGSSWNNDYDSSLGHTLGLTAGYSRVAGIPVRVEVEYLYRNNEFDDRVEPAFSGGKSPEFQPSANGQIYGRLGDIQSHNVFANLYYDFPTDSKFTPYVGSGVGWSRTKADLLHFFQRNDNGDTATGSDGHPDFVAPNTLADCTPTAANDCVLEALEGTVSYSRRTHEDTLFGFQFLLGFDYALSDKLSAGLKLRWAYFSELEGDPETWDVLRNHASTVSPDDNPDLGDRSSNLITYTSGSKDTQLWGAALSLKYYLN